jgi:hypothetical protein
MSEDKKKKVSKGTVRHVGIEVNVHDSPVEACLEVVFKLRGLSKPPFPILECQQLLKRGVPALPSRTDSDR